MSAGDSDFLENDVRASQAAVIGHLGFDVAVRHGDFRAHLFECREMQIDRTRADGAASGKGNAGNAEAGHERAEGENGGAHGFHQLVGSFRMIQRGSGNGVIAGRNFGDGNGGAHEREKFAHGDQVANFGDVVHGHFVGGEQSGGHYRQRGIFRAADAHGSVQGLAAFD